MKTLGIIGGMSYESSKLFYELINNRVNDILGGYHCCKSIMYTVDFDEIVRLQNEEKWDELNLIVADVTRKLEAGGADLIVLCTNTLHICADAIINATKVPFLHIAETVGEEAKSRFIKKAGLLGTKFTMEKDFYKDVLKEKYGIDVIIPGEIDRDTIHNVIFGELVHGQIRESSRKKFIEIINRLERNGAEGIILGCTDIPLLISEEHLEIPIFDSIRLHAEHSVRRILSDELNQ
ncbi:MAG TPA: aspartate/glutamate racemase family protein [Clostridiales bacterium]|nr:aspartate/glutamate racemase family protein [Clostridiales bacterium]HQP68864.1 aspartate/glutamate racemase family protein [Clostridiales bacterium]